MITKFAYSRLLQTLIIMEFNTLDETYVKIAILCDHTHIATLVIYSMN